MVKRRKRPRAHRKGRSQEQLRIGEVMTKPRASNGQVMVKRRKRPRAHRKGRSPEQSSNGSVMANLRMRSNGSVMAIPRMRSNGSVMAPRPSQGQVAGAVEQWISNGQPPHAQ